VYKYHLLKQGITCDENKIEVRKNKIVKTQETKMYLTLKNVYYILELHLKIFLHN
jgi:hypothetical protein